MTQVTEHQDTTTLTFDPFSRHQFYTEVNRALVERTLDALEVTTTPGEVVCIVELASGTGAVTELILDGLARRQRPAVVVGVDPSPYVSKRQHNGWPVVLYRLSWEMSRILARPSSNPTQPSSVMRSI